MELWGFRSSFWVSGYDRISWHKKSGHRPRRSLFVCSWDAEGLVGSSEWFDENSKFISEKFVAYLNVDTAVEGNHTISIKSSDQMVKSISEAAKNVPSLFNHNGNLFQDLLNKELNKESDQLEFNRPGGIASDNTLFSHAIGIAVSEYRFTFDKNKYPKRTLRYTITRCTITMIR